MQKLPAHWEVASLEILSSAATVHPGGAASPHFSFGLSLYHFFRVVSLIGNSNIPVPSISG